MIYLDLLNKKMSKIKLLTLFFPLFFVLNFTTKATDVYTLFTASSGGPSKVHCITKDAHNHKVELRLRLNYETSQGGEEHTAVWRHNDTDPNYITSKHKQSKTYDRPAANETLCFPVKDQAGKLTDNESALKFRIDIKHAADCKTWDIIKRESLGTNHDSGVEYFFETRYDYDNSTQTYVTRYYHFGTHTHCHNTGRG